MSRERNFYHNLFKPTHPSMAQVPRDGYFEVDGCRFLVMQRLGDTLTAKLRQGRPFSVANLALAAHQIVRPRSVSV